MPDNAGRLCIASIPGFGDFAQKRMLCQKIVVLFIYPETKGQTLERIQANFGIQ
jgi:hypothetical protein